MYLVKTAEGEVIETPIVSWLKFNKTNLTPYGCAKEDAQAVEAEGVTYRLIDMDEINESYVKAEVNEVDDGWYNKKIQMQTEQNTANIDYLAMEAGINLDD